MISMYKRSVITMTNTSLTVCEDVDLSQAQRCRGRVAGLDYDVSVASGVATRKLQVGVRQSQSWAEIAATERVLEPDRS